MRFFVGLHQPNQARHFGSAFISVNRLRGRKGPFPVGEWIMDSGAFSTILTHGGYPNPVGEYADQIRRWKGNGTLLAAVSQDYMCEPKMLEITGMSIEDHQRLTIERYDALVSENTGVYIMPVLQGYNPGEYIDHLIQYGNRLPFGAWVGVGSVCKRNGNVRAIEAVLEAIKRYRPDLRLHGFGLKKTALSSDAVRTYLESADSMAWSFAARMAGRNANDYREAQKWTADIFARPIQGSFMPQMVIQ